MRLYAMQNQASVHNEDFGDFDVVDGAVTVPDAFGAQLRATYVGGKQAWENEAERHARLIAEELERRRDPASLFDTVERLTQRLAEAETSPRRRPRPSAAE